MNQNFAFSILNFYLLHFLEKKVHRLEKVYHRRLCGWDKYQLWCLPNSMTVVVLLHFGAGIFFNKREERTNTDRKMKSKKEQAQHECEVVSEVLDRERRPLLVRETRVGGERPTGQEQFT